MNPSRLLTLTTLLAALALPALAQTTVKDAWVRGTVPAQKASGAFMQITSAQGGRLLSVSTPVAGLAEIHEMTMEGNVMAMAALPQGLALPAGQTVALKPGGYHVMLLNLKQVLKAGDSVPLSLTIEGKDGQRETVQVKATVKPLGMPAEQAGHPHMH